MELSSRLVWEAGYSKEDSPEFSAAAHVALGEVASQAERLTVDLLRAL